MKNTFLKSFLLLVLVFLGIQTFANNPAQMVVTVRFDNSFPTDGSLRYNRQRPLTYDDFVGVVPENAPPGNVAQTVAVIGYQMKSRTVGNRTDAIVTLSLVMAPNTSWMKPAGRTPEILRHEQTHFDIAAIYACRLKEQIASAAFRPATFKEQLRQIYNDANRATAEEQARYDLETLHGIDRNEQARWEAEIAERLRETVCF